MEEDLLLDGEIVEMGDEFLSICGSDWLLLPAWTWGKPLDLNVWGVVRRKQT